jgi:hypothetical protein
MPLYLCPCIALILLYTVVSFHAYVLPLSTVTSLQDSLPKRDGATGLGQFTG